LFPPSSSHPGLERIILCSGKIYYDLVAKRKDKGLDGKVALVRIEEIAPFPWTAISDALDTYMSSDKPTEVVWAQEEPKNQGPWPHVGTRLETVLKAKEGVKGRLNVVGRTESAVPAVGVGKVFQRQKVEVLEEAFSRFRD
jgi:probable 2-oxoglutarate dehydrogenase E1 component DHKTD1